MAPPLGATSGRGKGDSRGLPLPPPMLKRFTLCIFIFTLIFSNVEVHGMESTGEWRGQARAGEVDLSNFQKRTLNVFYGVYGFMLRVPKIMHVKHRPNQSGIFFSPEFE
jgi:hypothetical protein